jgi:hypothetical protein
MLETDTDIDAIFDIERYCNHCRTHLEHEKNNTGRYCIRCFYAKELSHADSPSGPTDAVNCTCVDKLDDIEDLGLLLSCAKEFIKEGYMNIWRLEVLVDKDDDDCNCDKFAPRMGDQPILVEKIWNGSEYVEQMV